MSDVSEVTWRAEVDRLRLWADLVHMHLNVREGDIAGLYAIARKCESPSIRWFQEDRQARQRAIRAVVAAQWRDSFLWLHTIAMCRNTSIERLCEMLAGGLTFDLSEAECGLPTPEEVADGA